MTYCGERKEPKVKERTQRHTSTPARQWDSYDLDDFEEIVAFYLGAKTGPEPVQGTPATIDMAIYSLTPEGKFTDISRAGVKMLGYASKEEILQSGEARALFYDEGDRKKLKDILERQGYVKDYEILLRKKTGEKLNIVLTGRALHDETGKTFSYRGIIRDITPQRQLEDFNQAIETIMAERTMSILALTLADKVRNPATVIGILSRRMLDREISIDLKESLLGIKNEAGKLDAMVREFQSMLRDRHSVFKYEDVNEALRSMILLIEKEADRKGIKLFSDLSGDLMRINMQRDLWSAALLQIARNAIEATPSGGQITIKTYEENDYVIVAVSDTGLGIPEDEIEKIFDPLFTTKPHHYGMGLPLVKQIVSEHMGTTHLESKEGEGTTLRMVFPARWR